MLKEKSKEVDFKFGETLKQLRKMHDLSLEQAARKIGIGKTTLWDYENDKYKNPSISVLKKICKYYGIDFESAYLEGKITLDISDYSPMGTRKAYALHIEEKENNYNKKEENDE